MERVYSVYKIIAPSGKFYIGYTSLSLKERLRHHLKRAESGESKGHPFYDDIRKIGRNEYKIELIQTTDSRITAMQLEKKEISKAPTELLFNLSSGGLDDSSFGGKIFWERINANPIAREAYIKKLSNTKLANDWSDYKLITKAALEWREKNPRKAYKMSARAVRMANKANGEKQKVIDERSFKEKLMWKFKRGEKIKENTTKFWNEISDERRQEIGKKISESHKERFSIISYENKQEMTKKARGSIDRFKQGKAASQGVKQFWVNLKADPEKYQAYMSERTSSLMKTIERKNKLCEHTT